mmetsp:Transcript_5696/g.13418  ORF Transcript_5696/g.13418 Transcript_5696/m.13418 type:complete len:1146 (+) Transcript_5696:103-3540(+)
MDGSRVSPLNHLLHVRTHDNINNTTTVAQKTQSHRMSLPTSIYTDDSSSGFSSVSDSYQFGNSTSRNLPPLNTCFVGRENELKELGEIFKYVLDKHAPNHEKSAVVILEGYSGSGKTELVSNFFLNIKTKNPALCLLTGKFDNLLDAASTDSFSAMFAALTSLKQHFSEPNGSELKTFQEDLEETLGEELKILVQLIPRLGDILGDGDGNDSDDESENTLQPETLENGRNRLRHLFLTFFKTLASETRPVVLFLDDIQWMDDGSTDLLHALLADESQNHLMVIGSVRGEDKYADRLDSLNKGLNRKIHKVPVGDLSLESIETFLSTTLRREDTKSLSEIFFKKTHGNVFHMKQMLEIMMHKGILTFDFAQYQWICDEKKANTGIPNADNVAELLIRDIKSIQPDIRKSLMYAAHIRIKFDLKLLEVVLKANGVDKIANLSLKEQLDSAAKAMILQHEEGSKMYTFSHDRILEAFRESLPADLGSNEELASFRLATGRALVEESKLRKRDSWLFFVGTKHLNEGYSIEPRSPENYLPQAQHNLEAGKRAIERSALKDASRYLQTGLDALKRVSETPWESHYDLILELSQRLAEVLSSLGSFTQGDEMSGEILQKATSLSDKLPTYSSLANSLGRREQHEEAYSLCKDVLYQLDAFPKHFVAPKIASALFNVKKLMKKHTNTQILKLPIMTDKEHLIKTQFLTEFGLRAFYTNRLPITLFCILLQIQMCFKSGLFPRAGQSFAAYGMIIADTFGDFVGASRMAEISRGVLKVTKGVFMEPIALFTVAAFIEAWNAPRNEVLDLLQGAMSSGILFGDFENAFRARGVKNIYAYVAGYGLPKIEESAEEVCRLCKQFEVEAILVMVSPFHLMLECLVGKRIVDWEFIGKTPPFTTNDKDPSATYRLYLFYLYRLQLAYYFGEFELAGEFIDKLEPYYKTDTTFTGTTMRVFFSGLASFALMRKTRKKKYKKRSKRFLSDMEKMMQRGGRNLLQKFLLMKAEYTASQSKNINESEQKVMYDEAIRAASRAGFTNDAALANELAGFFCLRRGDEGADDAGWYLNRAKDTYDEWGAHGKSQHVNEKSRGMAVNLFAGDSRYDSKVSSRRINNQSNAVAKWTHGSQDLIKHVTGVEAPDISLGTDSSRLSVNA